MACCYKKKSVSQNDEKSFLWLYRPKFDILWFEKIMIPKESSWNFFIKGLRLVKPAIPESFSPAADGHRKRGRFLVELPIYDKFFTQFN
jgi:hypothetical protein